MMQAMPQPPRISARTFAALALLLAIGTVVAFVGLLFALVPMPPVLYLGALALAVALAVAGIWQVRHWLTVTALALSVLLLGGAALFHFVAARVPTARTALVVGQAAPDFTLPDATGRPARLADYRGHKPVVLVFYRGYW
jgi:hypothetical protein